MTGGAGAPCKHELAHRPGWDDAIDALAEAVIATSAMRPRQTPRQSQIMLGVVLAIGTLAGTGGRCPDHSEPVGDVIARGEAVVLARSRALERRRTIGGADPS